MFLDKEEKQIINIIRYVPIILLLLLSFVVTALVLYESKEDFNREVKNLKDFYYQEHKEIIKNDVDRVYDRIVNYKNKSETLLKKSVKEKVDNAYKIIESIYNNYKDIKTEAEIIEMIKAALRPVSFYDGLGYYFIYDLDGEVIMHGGDPLNEGKNLWTYKDSKGKYLIQEMKKLLSEKDETFYEWYWKKPSGEVEEYKKIGFFRLFKPYHFFIGAGQYIDEFENSIKKTLLEDISNIRDASGDGYVFVTDYNGVMLTHIDKSIIGKNMIGWKDKYGFLLIEEIIKKAKGNSSGFLSYGGVKRPSTNKIAFKTTYTRGFDKWNWAIGTGFYNNSLNKLIAERRVELEKNSKNYFINIIVISVILTIFLLLLSIYISNVIKSKFNNYKKLVNIEIEKNKEKDNILAQQSKMAAMGEMIGAIAHQWRQPLSLISTASSGVKMQREFGSLTDELLDESMDAINHSVQHLSQTIEDFRNFFNPNKTLVSFSMRESFEKTFKLVEAQYSNNNIELISEIDEISIYGLENELLQVFINILNNAKDQLNEKNIEKKIVLVKAKRVNERVIISILDNGGGINEGIMDKVFDSYFTTKTENIGTGIGLYMSKSIIEKNMKGKLTVSNKMFTVDGIEYYGAKFIIDIPIG